MTFDRKIGVLLSNVKEKVLGPRRRLIPMSKPVILAVDDDPEVLNAVGRDLRHHFRTDYRVVKASSGQEALETTNQLRERNEPIALFLVDERMPNITGTQFLV